jgi:hypothetical protein
MRTRQMPGLFFGEANMREAIYLIAVVNIVLGLYFLYGKRDVFRGRTIEDAASKAGKGENDAGR